MPCKGENMLLDILATMGIIVLGLIILEFALVILTLTIAKIKDKITERRFRKMMEDNNQRE
jgi:hypothetical protein